VEKKHIPIYLIFKAFFPQCGPFKSPSKFWFLCLEGDGHQPSSPSPPPLLLPLHTTKGSYLGFGSQENFWNTLESNERARPWIKERKKEKDIQICRNRHLGIKMTIPQILDFFSWLFSTFWPLQRLFKNSEFLDGGIGHQSKFHYGFRNESLVDELLVDM
jgi:hypothetical protein